MFDIIQACPPATMVAETAPIVADGSPYDKKLVNNIVMNNNVARR
jgi:hypothetical protein